MKSKTLTLLALATLLFLSQSCRQDYAYLEAYYGHYELQVQYSDLGIIGPADTTYTLHWDFDSHDHGTIQLPIQTDSYAEVALEAEGKLIGLAPADSSDHPPTVVGGFIGTDSLSCGLRWGTDDYLITGRRQ